MQWNTPLKKVSSAPIPDQAEQLDSFFQYSQSKVSREVDRLLSLKRDEDFRSELKVLVDGLRNGQFHFLKNDEDSRKLESLLWDYHMIRQMDHKPKHFPLLDTTTFDKDDPRNPHFLEKKRLFWFAKPEVRTWMKKFEANGALPDGPIPEEVERYWKWLASIMLMDPEKALENPKKLEAKAMRYVNGVIAQITVLFEEFEELLENGKSPSFDKIHVTDKSHFSEERTEEHKSIFSLLALANDSLDKFRIARKEQVKLDKKRDALLAKWNFSESEKKELASISEELERLDRTKKDRNKAMYEISRILGISMDHIMQSHMPGAADIEGDTIFLITELLGITNKSPDNIKVLDILHSTDNPFFEFTNTKEIYWRRKEGGWYEYLGAPVPKRLWDPTTTTKLESIEISGNTNLRWHAKSVKILHVNFKKEKTKAEGTYKRIRKELESHREVLDTRGFQFVVETLEDAKNLQDILAYGLSSGPESAWAVAPVLSKNPCSWVNYACIKGTLNVFDKRTNMKKTIDRMMEELADEPEIAKRFSRLMTSWQILETEIQIFIGMDAYIAAQKDPKSPAYHWSYKSIQHKQALAQLIPPNIFPEAYETVASSIIQSEYDQLMSKIMQNAREENLLI